MKKRLLSLAFLPMLICAADTPDEMTQEREAHFDAARVVKYTITIYRDTDNYDQSAWRESLQRAVETIEQGSESSVNEAEFVDNVVRSLRTMYTRSQDNSGMHGLIQIGIGDGQCSTRCSSECSCKAEFNGVCPCSTGIDSCRGGQAEVNQKELVNCEKDSASQKSCCK